jgi:hypothetical protein
VFVVDLQIVLLKQFTDHIGCKVVLITGFQIRGFHIDEICSWFSILTRSDRFPWSLDAIGVLIRVGRDAGHHPHRVITLIEADRSIRLEPRLDRDRSHKRRGSPAGSSSDR